MRLLANPARRQSQGRGFALEPGFTRPISAGILAQTVLNCLERSVNGPGVSERQAQGSIERSVSSLN